MDNDNERCGCYLNLAGICHFSWLIMTITGGGSSNYSAPTNPTYTTPKPAPTYTTPTINYPSRPVVPEPSYSASSRSETPDDAYDNGMMKGMHKVWRMEEMQEFKLTCQCFCYVLIKFCKLQLFPDAKILRF